MPVSILYIKPIVNHGRIYWVKIERQVKVKSILLIVTKLCLYASLPEVNFLTIKYDRLMMYIFVYSKEN